MLSSHTDVVPVEPAHWTRSPFGGEIADGCVWGRGAIDMKAKCAMDLGVMLALKRTGLTPESVRVNLHRGMKLLRERLHGDPTRLASGKGDISHD